MRLCAPPVGLAGCLLLLVVACSGNVQTTTQETSGGGDGSGGAGAGAGGQVSLDGNDGSLQLPCSADSRTSPDYQPFECPLPSPCEAVRIRGPEWWPADGGSVEIQNPEAAMCVLTHLRDRTLSQLQVEINPGAIVTQTTTIFVLDAEHAAANRHDRMDLITRNSTLYHELLRPPSYFDACSRLSDHTMIATCLTQWSDGCADIGGVACPR
jgi:hypothetical protein